MKKRLSLVLVISMPLFFESPLSEPWCHRGSIAEVAKVTLSGPALKTLVATTPGIIATDSDYTKAFAAGMHYCASFAGGGGGGPLGSVPDAGTVGFAPDQSYSQTYTLSQGLSFICRKCYTVLPFHQLQYRTGDDGDRVVALPFPGLSAMKKYVKNPRAIKPRPRKQ